MVTKLQVLTLVEGDRQRRAGSGRHPFSLLYQDSQGTRAALRGTQLLCRESSACTVVLSSPWRVAAGGRGPGDACMGRVLNSYLNPN